MTKGKIYILLPFLILILNVYSPYKLEFIGHYNKILGHRANSIEKLKTGLFFFKGVELDLVYNKQTNNLDVNHPPVKSINLSLKSYLNAIPSGKKPNLWLDIKNLNSENSAQVLEHLENLLRIRKYPHHKILIESSIPDALTIFSKKNFKVSYYVPTKLYKETSARQQQQLEFIRSHLTNNCKMTLSSNFKNYSLLQKEFPKTDKHLWILSRHSFLYFFKIKKILNDATVKTVLTSYPSFNNR